MKIAILSREAKNYSTTRLKETCVKRGHQVKVFDTMKFSIYVEQGKPSLLYRNKRISSCDAIIPRIGASITFFGSAVVRQFEQMGIFCVNTSNAINTSRDKLRAIQVLSRHKLGIPVTAFVMDKNSIMPTIDAVGQPVVIKLLEGTQGIGVILADTRKVAEAIIETLHSAEQNVLIQKFVEESKGRDIRAFVVGGRVVAAMRRKAHGDEFRSNVHRGGSVESITLSPDYEKTAVRAAQIMGLNVAGVDMLEGNEGPKLMEVNSSPGLEGIERASGVDVAGAVVEYLEQRVQFPEFDIRQRLTLTSGYGVAEVPVHTVSELINKKINETRLRERDILVISITRGGETIPNPRGDRQILGGDTLLCFGKLETLKSIIPAKALQTRKRKKAPNA
jgi:ribosomal protein S6--L-glutamate ligase